MAGDWIKMRTNLDSDVRVIELSELLQIPELHVVGCLWKLWSWADMHTHDGNAIRVTCVTLDKFTGVTGFAEALRKVGWLEGRDSALTFPRFAEHNGQTAKKRAETKERVAKHRSSVASNVNEKCNADVTQNALPEKRREEKRNIEVTKVTSSGVATAPPAESSGLVFAMQAGTWDMPAKHLAEYVATYRFDVKAELLKAALWLRDNRERRPRTPPGVKKFLTRWLNRQDGTGQHSRPEYKPPSQRKKDPEIEFNCQIGSMRKRARAEEWPDEKIRHATEVIRRRVYGEEPAHA